jgi:hypothetical protein
MSTNSNGKFPMPEVVNSPHSVYAPRVKEQLQAEGFSDAPTLDLRASVPRGAEAIKSWLKTLTHREMREFVAEIFDAYKKLHPQPDTAVLAPAITSAQLADVLDAVAHGDGASQSPARS